MFIQCSVLGTSGLILWMTCCTYYNCLWNLITANLVTCKKGCGGRELARIINFSYVYFQFSFIIKNKTKHLTKGQITDLWTVTILGYSLGFCFFICNIRKLHYGIFMVPCSSKPVYEKVLISINKMIVFGVVSSAHFLLKVVANSTLAKSHLPLKRKWRAWISN